MMIVCSRTIWLADYPVVFDQDSPLKTEWRRSTCKLSPTLPAAAERHASPSARCPITPARRLVHAMLDGVFECRNHFFDVRW